ncbi:hypothetical protein GCM10028812_05410 [Ancylobacter sonchi]
MAARALMQAFLVQEAFMVDLRVIDGGGGGRGDKQAQWAEEMAAQALERLGGEILRGAARGPENACRVGAAVRNLYEHLTPVPPWMPAFEARTAGHCRTIPISGTKNPPGC